MTDFIRFFVLGLASGGVYTLLALGLIVVFRSSGVVNFSTAAIGLAAGYLYYDFHNQGMPLPLAIPLAIVSGLVLGAVIHGAVMRSLSKASGLTKAIATLAVLAILQSAMTLRYGSNPVIPPSFLPQHRVDVLGATITTDYLIVLGISVVLVAVLALVYRRTKFGLATTAVAENEFAFAGLGRSPALIAAVNWAVGGTLAAVAGVLIAPFESLQPSEATSLLIPALAVALFGSLRSFPAALVGGLLLGVAQSELVLYSTTGPLQNAVGLANSFPFLLIIVVLAVRGRSLPSRDFVGSTLPKVGSGRLSAGWLAFWLAVAVLLVAFLSDNWVMDLTTGTVASVTLLSMVVITGYAGQLSLAQVSIGGVGVMMASQLVATFGWPMPVAAIAGVLAALPVGFLIGLPAVRTRGVTLAVVTLGLAETLNLMLFQRNDVTGGESGLNVGNAQIFGLSINELEYPRRYAIFALIILGIIGFGVANLRRSGVGKLLIAVRANERAAASLGVNVTWAKLYAFMVASAIAVVGGLLEAWRLPYITFANFDPFTSVNAVVSATLGGVGFLSGGILGGNATTPGGIGGQLISDIGLGQYLALVSGGLLLVNIVFNPNGVVPNTILMVRGVAGKLHVPGLARLKLRMVAMSPLAWLRRPAPAFVQGAAPVAKLGPVKLRVEGLKVVFGTTAAVDGLSLECHGGEVLGLIGPNGAGKTTVIDAITGYVRSAGTIQLDGVDLGSLAPHQRSRLGLIRSFQSLELFEELSVADNLSVASEQRGWFHWFRCFVSPGRERPNAAVVASMREFGLEDDLARAPSELPYGKRRLLAISRALATAPRVLLLDEPAAGLTDADREELSRLLRRLADEWGMAVLLVEHDVDLVMTVSDRVMAMEFGKEIAEGPPERVRSHPEVVRAYLGSDDVPQATPAGLSPERPS
jgi:ABC-type branched-subunit amino acid transport system ATPase component/ABC-type branched-subunit amino acid transport system permease subunit